MTDSLEGREHDACRACGKDCEFCPGCGMTECEQGGGLCRCDQQYDTWRDSENGL